MKGTISVFVPPHIKEFLLNCFGTDNYLCPDLNSFIGRLLQLSAEKTNTVRLRNKKDIIPVDWVEIEIKIPASLRDYDYSAYTQRNMGRVFEEFYKMAIGFFVWGAKDYQPKDQTITTEFLEKTRTRGHVDENTARKMGVNIVTYLNGKKLRQSKRSQNFFKKNSAKNPQKVH